MQIEQIRQVGNILCEADEPESTNYLTGDGVGGSEILDVKFNESTYDYSYMNKSLMDSFGRVTAVKVGIVLLLALLAGMIILRIVKIKYILKGKGLSNSIDNIKEQKRRDNQIIRRSKMLREITKKVNSTSFRASESSKEYMDYTLARANIKAPGGYRYLKAEEYNALIRLCQLIAIMVGLLISVFINLLLGIVVMASMPILISTFTKMSIRHTVAVKDEEIEKNFFDLYQIIHYPLMSNSGTPIVTLLKTYRDATTSEEMVRFATQCIELMETYGEYRATALITKAYREIPNVGRLMRLIKQSLDGGEVKKDLEGFRVSLIQEQDMLIEDRMKKNIAKVETSLNVIMIILFQAIISAMAIYVPDLGGIGSILGQ